MKNDLISREALIKAVEELYEYAELDVIKAAPTVELTETEIQEVLNKRCMTAVANEYLIALHGNRPRGKWITAHGNIECNLCGCWFYSSELNDGKANYCPNCGVDMRGGSK